MKPRHPSGTVERVAHVVEVDHFAVGGIEEWHAQATKIELAGRESAGVPFRLRQSTAGPMLSFFASTTPIARPPTARA